jgi:hypothetical protein
MTRPLEETDGLATQNATLLNNIRTVGWHVVGVFAEKGDKGPEWAFSVGLFHSFFHPEVIVFGLPFQSCMSVINVIGDGIRSGKSYYSVGEYVDVLQRPHQCVFREVGRKHFQAHVGDALWFYESDPFPLLQCIWSDKQGHYPWDKTCEELVKNSQPLLFAK